MKVIEICKLNFAYINKVIFSNLNLTVSKGEIVAIKGKNGIGKSTLISLIKGNLPLQSGEIKIK